MAHKKGKSALVRVIMDTISDLETMKESCNVLDELVIGYEKRIHELKLRWQNDTSV